MTETVVTWPAEVDLTNAAVVEDQLHDCFRDAAEGDTVVVDLHHVQFTDSTGLGVLIAARTRAQETGTALVLRGASQSVSKALAITGITGLFVFQ